MELTPRWHALLCCLIPDSASGSSTLPASSLCQPSAHGAQLPILKPHISPLHPPLLLSQLPFLPHLEEPPLTPAISSSGICPNLFLLMSLSCQLATLRII